MNDSFFFYTRIELIYLYLSSSCLLTYFACSDIERKCLFFFLFVILRIFVGFSFLQYFIRIPRSLDLIMYYRSNYFYDSNGCARKSFHVERRRRR